MSHLKRIAIFNIEKATKCMKIFKKLIKLFSKKKDMELEHVLSVDQ